MITLKNINVTREGNEILKGVTWNAEKGQQWGILGLNGSGKTTLLKVITGNMWATAGTVDVLGNQYGMVNLPELRKSIGWVSAALDQQFNRHDEETALEIVLSGKHASIGLFEPITAEDVDRAHELLAKFNISHLTNEPLKFFSQGERKKVLLARAWMSNLELLILDEPCSGLDLYAREEFLDTLEVMKTDENAPTLLYVTHHLEEIIPSISHMLLLHDGEIVAAGPKKDVITEENLTKTFQVPVSLSWHEERPWIRVKKEAGLNKI
ncbi:ABC transporter ATP-binding protein [Paenalkalicoccus suaedae]|uniref:ABC transporter ATP-binding protein n=1 Tax=Paenalkalicoccus suaedae TaxID=2592382 RepID=A0A859FJE8_9BACI|nr:ABC transporter ATP-binding protein [Paenalkalicoccus suaedae]QKS72933.1 ABC transporter ATP-binding protein [Paenalkalicoccus suaedae]